MSTPFLKKREFFIIFWKTVFLHRKRGTDCHVPLFPAMTWSYGRQERYRAVPKGVTSNTGYDEIVCPHCE